MEIAKKLKIIQKLSELTQTQLADRLNISFPTLNSWINRRSIPHLKKIKTIDELYYEYTGQKIIPTDELAAKKDIIRRKSKKLGNIMGKIKSRPDIFDQFVLSLTYNTNSIEGSTLTENDTAAILFQNLTLKNKKLIEHLEAKNHQSALEYLFNEIKSDYKISEDFILKLHQILMNSIRPDAGIYRDHGVRIVGANVPTANYIKIPKLMENIVNEINTPPEDIITQVSIIHSEFEKIHPFSDGNGRIGRLIMTAMLLKENLPPAIIKQEQKGDYYKYLKKSQQREDFGQLEEFVCDAILNSFGILKP
jgi:Fic family protein